MSDAKANPSVAVTKEGAGPLSFSLEIRGGQTGFRRRPILGDRFLIGSDPVCDLRLDGRIGAPLHCLIRRDGAGLEAEQLTNVPMTVNGAPTTYAALKDGDTLGIAQVRLIVHAHTVRFDIVRPADDLFEPHLDASAADFVRTVTDRTASDLVGLIEIEEERVRDFDDRRRAGMAALLEAVRRSKRPAPDAAAEEVSGSLDDLVAQLDLLAAKLAANAHAPAASAEESTDGHLLDPSQPRLLKEIQRLKQSVDSVVRRNRSQRTAA